MRPCENVIVTVKFGKETLDMELPTFLPIKELTQRLEETFRVMKPNAQNLSYIELGCNGRIFDKEKNLAYYGIWDGSIIECRFVKGAAI